MTKKTFSLGYSPCPNDTYIFGGLATKQIATEQEYSITLADVEELNQLAMDGRLDITKLSYHAFAYLTDTYSMLPYGSALGFGVGPLLITADPNKNIEACKTIAIPGKYTTAAMLLDFAIEHDYAPEVMLFSDIEQAVLSGKVDAGVIIHENRFTYMDRGLTLLRDLGAHWESQTSQAIPLGGIAVRKSLSQAEKAGICQDLQCSIAFGDSNFGKIEQYIAAHAQEMDVSIMQKHIDLYVNASTRGMSFADKAAISYMLQFIQQANHKEQADTTWLFEV
jgi:1,4-dihydroxy-6-naphthoate synthase